MPTLEKALSLLGYDKEKSKSLIQIFHIAGIFDGKIQDEPLSESELEKKLQSDLGVTDGSDLAIAQKLNELGQKKFQEIRGAGERQEMYPLSIATTGFIDYFKDLKLSETIPPEKDVKLYFIFGASEAGLRNRIGFLRDSIGHDELESKDIIFLGGDRKLWPKYTGDNEYLLRSTPGEDATFKLIEELNPDQDIKEIKKEINQFFEEKKQDLMDGKINVARIRVQIVEEVAKGIKWPTESDLERYLAKEILAIDDARVIEGEIDPKIGRPTTETNLQAIPKSLPNMIKSQPKSCFVSSQPHIGRQTSLARSLSGLNNIAGCGKEALSLMDSKNITPMLEAVLGEVNSQCRIKEKEHSQEVKGPRVGIEPSRTR